MEVLLDLSSMDEIGYDATREVSAAHISSPDGADGNDVADSIRRDAQTQWQPVGTCRIDNDPRTVVGPELAVSSVENLMVANAPVVPAIGAAE
ncbi:GMC oxidoreductase [Streptomyces canus]|uniref:GMC oxidoreductase n=1 Tax=Streptomyces canus TaxID=58343 RepID=UPI000368899F|nr:GMC oxidoreductase [Streptomyces canus]